MGFVRSLAVFAAALGLLAPIVVGRAEESASPVALEAQSEPSGAHVVVDDHDLGLTPLLVDSLPPGHYHVALELSGYVRWEAEVDLAEGEATVVQALLEPLPGRLQIVPSGASAWVTVDSQPYGLSPAVVDVQPGQHRVRLDREGSQPWVADLDLGPGEARWVQPDIPPLPQRVPPLVAEPWPLAVMIENSDAARPQTGLVAADVVYEALAEGGISRFLAIYLTGDPEEVGPVRSARHYFVYAAAEFNATLVHVGSSPIGFAALSAVGIRRIDYARGDPGFWRASSRYAPHNAYVNLPLARASLDARDSGGPGSWASFWYKSPEDRFQGPAAPELTVRYPAAGYSVGYSYVPETNRYLRWMAGAPHTDALTGEQIQAASVVVQYVPTEVIDREGRLEIEQVGEGRVLYFLDGVVLEGTWTKADYGSVTLFWDTAGNRMRFNQGPLWVQIVPLDSRITY